MSQLGWTLESAGVLLKHLKTGSDLGRKGWDWLSCKFSWSHHWLNHLETIYLVLLGTAKWKLRLVHRGWLAGFLACEWLYGGEKFFRLLDMCGILKAKVIQFSITFYVTNVCLNCCYPRCLQKELNILYATESFQLSSSDDSAFIKVTQKKTQC